MSMPAATVEVLHPADPRNECLLDSFLQHVADMGQPIDPFSHEAYQTRANAYTWLLLHEGSISRSHIAP